MKDFITRLLDRDPETRLGAKGAKQVKKHKWFKNINFKKILNQKYKPTYVPEIEDFKEQEIYLLDSYQAKKMKKYRQRVKNKQDLLETCLDEGRKKMIDRFKNRFDKF